MKKSEKLLVLGGDRRFLYAADCFGKLGYDCRLFGFDSVPDGLCAVREDSLEDALRGSRYIVLPLPYRKGAYINAPLCSAPPEAERVIQLADPGAAVFCGKADSLVGNSFPAVYDYSQREDFAILNAWLTAEAAVGIAVNELPTSLKESVTAILGYGRIGRATARLLHGFGTNFTVYARRDEIFAMLESNSYAYSDINELIGLGRYDLIINTVPKVIIGRDRTGRIKKGAVFLDLASEPGGIDKAAAEERGVRVICARGLPGKYSPASAGKVICEVINKIIYSGV